MDLELLTTLLFHVAILAIVALSVYQIVREIQSEVERNKIEGTFKVNTNKEPIFHRLPLVGSIYRTLHKKLSEKGKESLAEPITGGILFVSLIPFLVFGFFGQYLLMLLAPLALLTATKDILADLDVTKEDMVVQQLPRTIDNLIKTAGRHDNIQIALSEASYGLPQPMKGELEEMVRKMNSHDRRSVLEQFSDRYKSAWIRSFVFILISLVEDAERKTALDNLRTLREMIEQEQRLATESVSEKRSSAMQNYIICGMSFIASIIVMFTGIGRQFYFETGFGLLSLLGGYAFLYITVKMNINMMSKKGGN